MRIQSGGKRFCECCQIFVKRRCQISVKECCQIFEKAIVKSKKMLYNELEFAFSEPTAFLNDIKGETYDRRYKSL